MALASGTHLGPYEIVSPLGAGGMGEVYRAKDTKLNRDVAIKVLPDSFALDADRVARFTREAQVLASLNHPNIAAIYGIEESGSTRALVMELVEGEDLSAHIARGAIALSEALPIARQIADALEAAHEQGIVHRDLKPQNIKVRADGTVKVLDFGLAKAMDPAGASSDAAMNSPTMTARATQMGMIIGTAAYMSPEQAKGKAVDKRADIWAFGVVLYEMLTGRRAFEGEDISTTLAAVLMRDPDFTALPKNTPQALDSLIRRCLERDPKLRLRDIGEARLLLSNPQTMSVPSAPVASGSAAVPTRIGAGWVVATLGLAVASAVAIWWLKPAAPIEHESRFEIAMPEGASDQFALSPDGESLVFAAAGRLWLRRFGSVDPQPIPGTEGGAGPFWSPDSRSIAFFTQSKLKRVDLDGGSSQMLGDVLLAYGGGTGNASGTILVSTRRTVYKIPAGGGTPVAVTTLTGQQTAQRAPQFLPDGRHFLYYVLGAATGKGVYMGSLDDDRIVPVVDADTAAVPVPPDRIAFVRAKALMIQKFDVTRGTLVGEPEVVATQVGYDASGGTFGFSASATGRLAYQTGGAGLTQLTRFDRSGKLLSHLIDAEGTNLVSPVVSPDGRRAAVDRTVNGNRDVWLIDLARRGTTRFTFNSSVDGFPVWSPDGSQIAFESSRNGAMDIFVKPANGAAAEQPLLAAPGNQWPEDWSSDGRYLLYFDADQHNGDLMALPLAGADRTPISVATTEFTETTGAISPDGHWAAYDTNESGSFEVVVQAFPAAKGKWQVSTAGGGRPRWSRDGRELYFISADSKLMAAPVRVTGSGVEVGTPVALFQMSPISALLRAPFDAGADGTFVVAETVKLAKTPPIVVVLNWKPGAKK